MESLNSSVTNVLKNLNSWSLQTNIYKAFMEYLLLSVTNLLRKFHSLIISTNIYKACMKDLHSSVTNVLQNNNSWKFKHLTKNNEYDILAINNDKQNIKSVGSVTVQ